MMAMPSAATPVRPVAVDLFCGAGGLSYGMQKAGITIIGGIDIDPACKHPFEENVKANFYEYDVSDLTSDFVASLFNEGQTRILAGCAPCQPVLDLYSERQGTESSMAVARQRLIPS